MIVLSYALWRRRFGGDPAVVGRTITIDSTTATVIGVMPPGFAYPSWAETWQPIEAILATDSALVRRDVHVDSRVVGRIRPGVDRSAALAEMNAIAARLAAAYPRESAGWGQVDFLPLRDEVIGDVRPMLLTFVGAVSLVLLLACFNVANLSLVRASTRAREVAIRSALGAGRGRIVRQFLAESIVLAIIGGAVGFLFTLWAVGLLRSAALPDLPRAAELVVDTRVLGYALVLSLLTTVVFGLAPALRGAASDPLEPLRMGRQAATGAPRDTRARRADRTTVCACARAPCRRRPLDPELPAVAAGAAGLRP